MNRMKDTKLKIGVILFCFILSVIFGYYIHHNLPTTKVHAFTPNATVGPDPAVTVNASSIPTVVSILTNGPAGSGNNVPPFDYPNLYPTYYYFAAKNLFDNQDYWTVSGGITNASGTNIHWLYSGGDLNPQGKELGGSQFVTKDGKDHAADWLSSQCSGASLAEVLNSYYPGRPKYHIADTLEFEATTKNSAGHYIYVAKQGFYGPFADSFKIVANHFGFNSDYKDNQPITIDSVKQLLDIAQNQHHPLILTATDHYFVLYGADSNWDTDSGNAHLWLLDASSNFYTWDPNYPSNYFGSNLVKTKMSLNQFLGLSDKSTGSYWQGVRVLLTPQHTIGGALPVHGGFSIETPAEADQALSLGMTYAIPYSGGGGWQSETGADTTKGLGAEFAKNHQYTFVDATFGNTLYSCNGSSATYDPKRIAALVAASKDSPVVLGYWIKDDDIKGCNMKTAIKAVFNQIKTLDPNHYVAAGFGGTYSMNANYQDGEADLLGFYPYRAYNDYDTYKCGNAKTITIPPKITDKTAQFDCEVTSMVAQLQQATPKGKTPPPWFGIYQAFYGHNNTDGITYPFENLTDTQHDVETYVKNGAVSLVGFGFEAKDVQYLIPNGGPSQQGMLDEVNWITNYVKSL